MAKRKHILLRDPTRRDLKTRTKTELQSLCLALGIAYTGTITKLIDRILKVWELRTILKDFNNPQEIIATFKGKELKEMCRTALLWLGGNKYSKSASLLNWRNKCRKRGQQWVDNAVKEHNKKALLRYWGPV